MADAEARFLRLAATPDYTFEISDGALAVAVLVAPTPTAPGASDSRVWVAVETTGLAASLSLDSFASASATGVSILVNAKFGTYDAGDGSPATPASALNWKTAIDLQTGSSPFGADDVMVGSQKIDLAGDVDFSVSGTIADLSVMDFVHAGGGFDISKRTVNVSDPALTGADERRQRRRAVLVDDRLWRLDHQLHPKRAGCEPVLGLDGREQPNQ